MSPDGPIVAVVAHPDDAELMCFGTLLRRAREGAEVSVVIATHGAGGVSIADRAQGLRLDQRTRVAESVATYEGTGIAVTALGFADGALRADLDLISAIEHELGARRCATLITHKPNASTDHQDHHAVGAAATNAVTRVPSCTSILYGEPHAPRSGFAPDYFVELDEALLAAKVDALQQHATQAGRWYLSEHYTRHRAYASAWAASPRLADNGAAFEAFERPLQIDLLENGGVTGA
jgi:LmbE family N-acetylglucosaminyl deacetylase